MLDTCCALDGLASAKGKVPSPRGPILIDWTNGDTFQLSLTLPEGVPARVELPATARSTGVHVNGKPVKAERKNKRWILEDDLRGTAMIEVK